MKNLIITVVVLGGLGFGYSQLRTLELDIKSLRGETKVVGRGDLTIPIAAIGEIGPLARHPIKSEASGEVVEITRQPGDLVRKGDLLIRLDRNDEQRIVDRATADVTRTEANLAKAKIRERMLQTVGLVKATAQIDQFKAKLEYAKFNLDKTMTLDEQGRASPDEVVRIRSTHGELLASLAQAEANLDEAKINIEHAEQDVILMQASYDQALTSLSDAEERLAETAIHSPVDGIVTQVSTQVGAVIQGGKSTFTGGTVLAIVADISKLYVRADVDEAEIGAVRDLAPQSARPGEIARVEQEVPLDTGTPVEVHVDSFRDEEFTGIIERIHPEPASRASSVVTYRVDILLTSENRHKLLLGMQADVEFTAESALDVVLVPHEAIRRNEDGVLGVYIPVEIEGAKRRGKEFVPCRFGLDNGSYAEVLEGLTEGMEVYTKVPRMTEREKRAAGN